MDELCAARAHRFVVSRSLLDRAREVNVSSLGRLPSKGMGTPHRGVSVTSCSLQGLLKISRSTACPVLALHERAATVG
jgi:hypothetical protein